MPDGDPFMLHIYAALAEEDGALLAIIDASRLSCSHQPASS
jgi:hypothetical protein